jgi:hypothetical protein
MKKQYLLNIVFAASTVGALATGTAVAQTSTTTVSPTTSTTATTTATKEAKPKETDTTNYCLDGDFVNNTFSIGNFKLNPDQVSTRIVLDATGLKDIDLKLPGFTFKRSNSPQEFTKAVIDGRGKDNKELSFIVTEQGGKTTIDVQTPTTATAAPTTAPAEPGKPADPVDQAAKGLKDTAKAIKAFEDILGIFNGGSSTNDGPATTTEKPAEPSTSVKPAALNNEKKEALKDATLNAFASSPGLSVSNVRTRHAAQEKIERVIELPAGTYNVENKSGGIQPGKYSLRNKGESAAKAITQDNRGVTLATHELEAGKSLNTELTEGEKLVVESGVFQLQRTGDAGSTTKKVVVSDKEPSTATTTERPSEQNTNTLKVDLKIPQGNTARKVKMEANTVSITSDGKASVNKQAEAELNVGGESHCPKGEEKVTDKQTDKQTNPPAKETSRPDVKSIPAGTTYKD